MGTLIGRPFGVILLTAAFLAAGLAGIAGFWVARVPGTSPLAQMVALAWSCTYLGAGVLMWRRSRLAAPAFLGAIGFLALVLWFVFGGGQLILVPLFVITLLFAFFGYGYLRSAPVLTS